MTPAWRAMAPADLSAVAAIERDSHAPLPPEGAAVFADRLRAFPAGCLVAATDAGVQGYAVAFPWRGGDVPPLGLAAIRLPDAPDCLYLHDIALRPALRGAGLVAAALDHLAAVACGAGLTRLALTAVHGSETLWTRHGFAAIDGPAPGLATYGARAVRMSRPLT